MTGELRRRHSCWARCSRGGHARIPRGSHLKPIELDPQSASPKPTLNKHAHIFGMRRMRGACARDGYLFSMHSLFYRDSDATVDYCRRAMALAVVVCNEWQCAMWQWLWPHHAIVIGWRFPFPVWQQKFVLSFGFVVVFRAPCRPTITTGPVLRVRPDAVSAVSVAVRERGRCRSLLHSHAAAAALRDRLFASVAIRPASAYANTNESS
jgi:hypothetical protein